jgi:hypothetical protein
MKQLYLLLLIALFALLSNFSHAQSGIITTIVGNGHNADTGNGGLATAASMCPAGCIIDKYGNVFIAEEVCNSVRKISSSGIITAFAGTGIAGYSGDGGPASAATLYGPVDLTLDSSGNSLYVSEFAGSRIRKIDLSTNIITTITGNGATIDSGDGGPATAAAVYFAEESCFDKHGNLYFATAANRVRRIDAITHIITTVAGTGTGGFSGDGGPATAARVSAKGVYVDTSDRLFIASDIKIRLVDPITHIISTYAGNDTGTYNGEGVSATLAGITPFRITGDKFGNLYFSDHYNQRIRVITPTNVVHTIAGNGIAGFSGDGGPADSAKIYNPEPLALDYCGNIIFDDNQNFRIRKITFPQTRPGITIYPSSSIQSLCYGMPITYTSVVTPPGHPHNYQWKVNGTNVGPNSPAYTYPPANGDSVQCIVSGPYCDTTSPAASNILHMVVGAYAPPVLTLPGLSSATIGATVTVSATIAGAGGTYIMHWRNKGVLFATTTAPVVTYVKTQPVDSITATMVSIARLCYDSVNSGLKVVVDSALSTSSVPSINERKVICYPNPAHNELYIEATSEIKSVLISNLLGQVVYSWNGSEKVLSINVSSLSKGMYFVKIATIGDISGMNVITERFTKN